MLLKFGIDENAIQASQGIVASAIATKAPTSDKASPKLCDQCGVEVEEKVAYYCRINKVKFNGKVFCRDCQQPAAQAPQSQPAISSESKKGLCDSCSAPVDSKVVYFCRINKNKFDGKIFCRDCQSKHSK